MEQESKRLESFKDWPGAFVSAKKLARFGFYFLKPIDEVKCSFCKVVIGEWSTEDNVLTEHARWSPECPLIKGRETKNQPIDEVLLKADLKSFDRTINYPDFAEESKRIESFALWSKTQKPTEMAEAGLFFTGKGDRVKCYICGGGLENWVVDDIPREQHTVWFPRCKRVQFNLNCMVYNMITWGFAYQEARKGKWEEAGRDRDRFSRRIKDVGEKISWLFLKEHRDKKNEK